MSAMEDAELRRQIVGTWTLVSVVYEDVASKERTPVYGEHPRGIQIATPEGRWLALMTAEGRTIPQTDADRAQALKSMIAYTAGIASRTARSSPRSRRRGTKPGSAASRCAISGSRATGFTSRARRCRTRTSTTRRCGSSWCGRERRTRALCRYAAQESFTSQETRKVKSLHRPIPMMVRMRATIAGCTSAVAATRRCSLSPGSGLNSECDWSISCRNSASCMVSS